MNKILRFDPTLKQMLSMDLDELSPERVQLKQPTTNSLSFNTNLYFWLSGL